MRSTPNPWTSIIVPIVMLSALSCARHDVTAPQSEGTPLPGAPVSINVRPPSALLTTGASLPMSAFVYDAVKTPVTTTVTWTTSDSTIVKVSNPVAGTAGVTGVVTVTGVSLGTATITATVGGMSATSSVTVYPPSGSAAAITITPADSIVILMKRNANGQAFGNTTFQLTVTVTDSAGNALPAQPVVWSSSDSTIATVSATGLVQANPAAPPSVVTVTATLGALHQSIVVAVNPPPATITITPNVTSMSVGDQVQLSATVVDDQGRAEIHGWPITWSAANHSVVTMSSTGLMTAVGAGASHYGATAGANAVGSGSLIVTVNP